MITQKINLNLIPGGVMPRVNVSQYDFGSRTLEITLYNGSSLFTIPTGAQVIIQGTKKDNRGFQYIDLDYTGSVVTADITQQMTVFEDEVQVELVIIKETGGNKQQLATANFILNVERAALKDDIVVSETDIPAIQTLPEAMAKVDYAVDLLEDTLPVVENDAKDAEAWAKGTKGGNPVASTEPQYHNNSKYYSEQASASAASVGATASNSEAYAVGKRNGVDVSSDDPAYHNNSKYYSEQAETSATNATVSASNASTSATNASTSESNASASAANANASENNAENYSLNSQSWAEGKRGNADVPNTDPAYHNNAKYYSEQASSSATNAATSASNAATSETNASSSASSALTSATNAATSETNAAASESSASASASNAATSATNAATSESNAATSERNAATSESNAANSEINAATSKSDSEAYAVETRNGQQITDITDPAYHNSAKFWAGQAQQAAGGGVTSFNGRSGTVIPQANDYTPSMVGLGNVDNTSDADKPVSTATQIALDEKAPKSDIAPSETSPTTNAHAVGDILYYNGTLYRAKTVIAVGDTLTVNTNIEATSIAETSGGHQIVDEAEVSYTQRSKLKFFNAVIKDDPTNDTTNVYVEGTGSIIVQPPTVTVGTYTYNGQPQGPTITWATGMEDYCIVTNTTKTDAGTYTLTIALKNSNRMIWTDMTTADKTYSYTIAKANQTITLSSNSVTLDNTNPTATVIVTGNQGSISASSSNTSKATVSVSGTTVTISRVGSSGSNATVTVTVTAASTTNYNSVSATVTVTVNYVQIVTFTGGTDAEIKAMLDAYYAGHLTWSQMGWAVGNTRTIHLNSMTMPTPGSGTWAAQNIVVEIVDHEHNDLATPINGHTKACITVQVREVMNNNTVSYDDAGCIFFNGTSGSVTSFTKWSNLYLRTYLNNTVLPAITYSPGKGSGTSFKNMIKQTKHYRHTNYNTSDDELVTDTLFLPSFPEMWGTTTWVNYVPTTHTEGTQFALYKTSANRIKYGNNISDGSSNGVKNCYWVGSPSSEVRSGYGIAWMAVQIDGNIGQTNNNNKIALAPAFVM